MNEAIVHNSFLTAADIAKVLQCSMARGYQTVRELNNELEGKGIKTMRGRTNTRFFMQRFGLSQVKI